MNWYEWVQSWIRILVRQLRGHESRISQLETKVETLMATVAELKADYEAFKTEVSTDVAALLAKVTDLQGQIAVLPNTTQEITDLAAEIVQDTTDLHSKAAPPAP